MLTLSVLLGILVALLTGGSLKNLADADFRAVGWLFSAFGLQALLHLAVAKDILIIIQWGWLIHLISYGLLFFALSRNLHISGVRLFTLGVALNFVVIAANGGRMPVLGPGLTRVGLDEYREFLATGTSLTHALVNKATRLDFLADVIEFSKPPFPRAGMGSIGDILMMIGVFIMIQFLAKSPHSQLSESTE